ncbi:MAG: prephenate/arogenate dehydrogenase [Leptolyngbyaceae bacterium]|nr:prephenate/arogenate dehydrogenase [Leptolyngbyaceae bacterium]
MKIGIIGLGLIGGSLGFDLKALNEHRIIGVSRRGSTCERAIQRGAVDEAYTDLGAIASADLIFICTPIGSIIPTLQQLTPQLPPTTIVTDVGSVKASIVYAAEQLWPNFVGGHPMAGTAENGIEAALKDLFVDRAYVITPTQATPPESVSILATIARSLKSNVHICSPENHDRAVAWISHLPVMVSASLISACLTESSENALTLAQTLASSGFRDTSRVGGGNPELGVMMARYNRDEVVRSLKTYQAELNTLTQLIEAENWPELEKRLQQTQQARPHFLQ